MASIKKFMLDVIVGGKVSSSLDSAFGKAATKIRTGINKATTTTGKMAAVAGGLGPVLTKGLTVPIVGALGASMHATVGFDKQMSRVRAISGATGHQFKALRKDAIHLGATTSFSAKQAAEGMENLASAGFSSKQIMQAMPGMLNLAASSGEDLASASDIAASAINGFGLKASSASHVADVLAKNAAKTNAGVADTGEALKYVAPIAHSAGLSMESVTAAIGLMSNAGIKGTQAGTSLRGALTRLMKPTKQVQAGLDKLGVSVYDSKGKMLPLPQIIGKIKKATKGMTDEEKQNALANIFGTNAMSGMMALVNAGPKKLEKLTKSYEHSGGASKKMAKQMMDNFAGAVTLLKSSLESAGISLGDALTPGLTKMAKGITKAVEAFNKLPEGVKHGVAWILVAAASIGPAMVGFSKVYRAAKDLKELKDALGVAAEALKGTKLISAAKGLVSKLTGIFAANPYLTAALAIAAAVALITLVIYKNRKKIAKSWAKVREGLGKLKKNTAKDLHAMGAKIKDWAAGWKKNGQKVRKSMKTVRKGLSTLRKNSAKDLSSLAKTASQKWGSFKKGASRLGSWLAGTFSKKWNKIWSGAGKHFGNAWNNMKTAAKSAMNWIIGKINGFIKSVDSIHVPNSKLVPKGLRGASLHISTIPYLAQGTSSFGGGLAVINESGIGGELVRMPNGTEVVPHDLSKEIVRAQYTGGNIVYAPTYNLYGSAGAEEIQATDQMSQKDFERRLKRYQHNRRATSFKKVVFE